MKKKPFHAPFERPAGPRTAPPASPARSSAPAAPPPRALTEEELWALATAGATPVEAGAGLVPPPQPGAPTPPAWQADLEAADELPSRSAGQPSLELVTGDSQLEGSVAGLDPALLRRLKRGGYAVEDRLDLHGLTRDGARGAVDRFLRGARLDGKRCVLLIHGRGRHSEDELPVLKEGLRGWLASGSFGRQVLAFSSARPADGGVGALYVLLRRAGR